MFKCEFCDKELSSKSILKTHQLKTRYCLERQKLLNIDVNIVNIPCQYCDKNFTHKHKRDSHQDKCVGKDKKELIAKYEKELETQKMKYETEVVIIKLDLETQKIKYEKDLETQKIKYEKDLETQKIKYEKDLEKALETIKERDIQISDLKDEKVSIYSGLFNKEHDFILNQNSKMADRQSVTNNTIKGKYVIMNALNLSQEKMYSIKDTYTLNHYERGGIGQADWVIENILKDESGNLVYRCTDKNRKNFNYRNEAGDIVTDIEAKKLKEAILPIMTTKLREYKKIKYNELSEVDDDDNSLLDKCNDLYAENKELGPKFDKRLIEKTYL